MKIKKEKLVEKVVVKYNDGTEKEIVKGVIITSVPTGEGNKTLTFEFANIKGQEVSNIILGTIQMGVELGLLDDEYYD